MPTNFDFPPLQKKWTPKLSQKVDVGLHPWLSRGLLAAIQSNSFEDVLSFIRMGADPFRKITLEERRDAAVFYPMSEALKNASMDVVSALWQAGKKIHPGASFEGHFGPEELEWEAKKRFDSDVKEMSPWAWRLLPKFLPESLTLLALEHDRPDVLSWCLGSGASPYPRVNKDYDHSNKPTHVVLKRAIFQHVLEKIRRATTETSLSYIGADAAMSNAIKSSMAPALFTLEHIAPRLPDATVSPILGLEEPIGKSLEFANKSSYYSDFGGFYAYAYKHHAGDLPSAAAAIGLDDAFRTLNTAMPDWLLVSMNSEPVEGGLWDMCRAIQAGVRNVEYDVRKSVESKQDDIVVDMFKLVLSETQPKVLKQLFYEPTNFFEAEKSINPGAWMLGLESWVQQKLLADRHGQTIQQTTTFKPMKAL